MSDPRPQALSRKVGKTPVTAATRERVLSRINAGQIVSLFQDHVRGKVDMTPTQVQAGKALLDRVLPTLSSVEAVLPDPRDQLQPTDVQAKLLALIERSPTIIKPLIDALLDRQPGMLDQILVERAGRATVIVSHQDGENAAHNDNGTSITPTA